MWAAIRHRLARENSVYVADPLPIRAIINMAGTIDMSANIEHMEEMCRGPVVTNLMGGTVSAVSDRYRTVSAQTYLPLGVSQVLIWGDHKDYVPQPLVEQYVDAARRAGDRARLIVVPAAGHFETASPSPAHGPSFMRQSRPWCGSRDTVQGQPSWAAHDADSSYRWAGC
jgi:pimeloyl-ACP methyl ester carboxylesterase